MNTDRSYFSQRLLIQAGNFRFGVRLRGKDFNHGQRVRRVHLVERTIDPHYRIEMLELGMRLVWRSFYASEFRPVLS
jgi:hypothetical protein